MCGILGFYDFGNTRNRHEMQAVGRAMAKQLDHRGPDARNCIVNRHAALGHTRLSIVDIKGGSQPMATNDKRFTNVYLLLQIGEE